MNGENGYNQYRFNYFPPFILSVFKAIFIIITFKSHMITGNISSLSGLLSSLFLVGCKIRIKLQTHNNCTNCK